MAIITPTLLGSINNGLQMAFNTQLYEAASVYKAFTFDATSMGAAEVYPRLDMIGGIREWIGPRVIQRMSQNSFTIRNRKFEHTIAISRDDISDDRYGLFAPIASEMGKTAKRFPDELIAQLMKNGTFAVVPAGQVGAGQPNTGFDGLPMFSTAHPNFDAFGNVITVSNYGGGTGPGWYLMDTDQMLSPFIFQERDPFELIAKMSLTDDSVFYTDEFAWGTRGRCNAGYGLWHLAYYSQQPFNLSNLIAARTAMALIRRPDGTPMGITPNTVVVPSTLFPLATSYYEDGLVGNDPTTPTTLVANTVRKMFKPIEMKWLN